MHRSFLFQNIDDFSKNGHISTDILQKLESTIMFSKKLSRVFKTFFSFRKTSFLSASALNKAYSMLPINSLRILSSPLKKVDFKIYGYSDSSGDELQPSIICFAKASLFSDQFFL